MDDQEIKKSIEGFQKTFADFKQVNDERLAEIAKGKADVLTEEKVNRAIEDVITLKESVEKMQAAAKRPAFEKQAEGHGIEQKHVAELAALMGKADLDAKSYMDYKNGVMSYIRKGRESEELKAMSAGSDPDGGYLLAPDTTGRIVKKVFETSPMRAVASVQAISTDSLEGILDQDEAGAGWVSEAGTRSETDTPQIGKWSIAVHEMYAEPKATQKLLDDASVNIEMYLEEKVADRLSRLENAAFVSGDGVGKPRGFLTYTAGTTLPSQIEQVATANNGELFTASAAQGNKLVDLVMALKGQYRVNGRFAMNRTVLKKAMQLVDDNKQYLVVPDFREGFNMRLLGYSIVEMNDMPDAATGSLSVAFADWAQAYQIVDRQGIRVLRDPYTAKPYVKFYTTKRVGGGVINAEAIKLLKLGS